MSIVSKDRLKKLIEPHFHASLQKEEYEVASKRAIELLTHTRFDIAFKLFYLDMKDKNEKLANKIYLEHIRAFSLGKFNEPGNNDKIGKEKFIEEFNRTFKSIKENGFDISKTLIPLSKNGAIANGAHRVASAIFLDQNIDCAKIETRDQIYDYNFFYGRGVPAYILDMVATKFIEYANNVHIAFIWPIGVNKNEEVTKLIPNIVYKKTIKLTSNGAHNLLSQIYYAEAWLGNRENNFSGVNGKLIQCFKTFDAFDVYAFQAEKLEDVIRIKENIRNLFNVGKHSIHITDTKEEALRVARLIFNENSIHFLNYAKPNRFVSTQRNIDRFKAFLEANRIEHQDALIDSSMILSCYGIREAKDIDFLCNDITKIKTKFEEINAHDNELKYYEKEKQDIIYDARNYFYYEDIKFVSFDLLYRMKKNRNEAKDRNDCKMMEALIENNSLKETINRIKQQVLYLKIKYKRELIQLLQQVGLFEIARKVYRKILK